MQQYSISSTVQEGTAVGDVRVPDNENTSLPIVMLLHGTSGDQRDMSDPAAHPGLNHDRKAWIPSIRDHGWLSYPGVSIWGHAVDPFGQVTGWQKALNDAGFRTVNYSQVVPRGSLVEPIAQLSALLHDLINDSQHQGRYFSLLGHSRGGILARALAVDAASLRPFDLTRIRQIITLHSPNQGSSLASLAISVNQLVEQLRGLPGADLIAAPLNFIAQEAGALAYHDYAVGSNFLRYYAAREPVAGIQYATFGGNSTIFTRHRLWMFTPDSVLPQWHLPPFHWRTIPLELGGLIPPGIALPQEMVHGIGDLLVTDNAARLPGAPHRTNPLNHAEALWDPGLQQQVVALLKTGAVPPLIDSAPIRAKHSSKVLDVAGISTANGAHIQQWDYLGGDNQKWRLESVGGGFYRIVAQHSGKVLDVAGISTANGARIQQYDYLGGDNQKWRFEPLGDGYYRIVAKHSGKVLDVVGVSTANGAQIQQWDWVGGDNQRWKL